MYIYIVSITYNRKIVVNIEGKHIDLITRFLSGNITESEKTNLDSWIGMSEENKNIFLSYKSTWDLVAEASPKFNFNVDAGWNRIQTTVLCLGEENIANRLVISPYIRSKQGFAFYTKRIAAVLLVAFGLFYLFNQKSQPEIQSIASDGSPNKSAVLPDGSTVYMNQNSMVSYPEVFASNQRLVDFKGEGFFEVAHNPEKPMIIETGNLRVKVLGTSFDLKNDANSTEVILYLQTGKVLFYSIDPSNGSVVEQIVLNPGQVGIYNKVSGVICRDNFTNNNFMAWKSGLLEFAKTPLSEVFEMLESTYDIQVVTPEEYDDCLLTATFDNETVEHVFESLEIIFGIQFQIEGQQVTLH